MLKLTTPIGMIMLVLLASGCSNSDKSSVTEFVPSQQGAAKTDPIEVELATATQGAFPQQILATGKVVAARQAELAMQVSGYLLELKVKPGQQIQRGDLVAQIDDAELQVTLEGARINLAQAQEQEADLIQQMGGTPGEDSTLSTAMRQTIRTRAKLDQAELDLKSAQQKLTKSKLTAPFSGTVADVKVQAFQNIGLGEVICRLMDPTSFSVDFKLLEGSALKVKTGQPVEVRFPSTSKSLRARITFIDPIVNEQGLVHLQAKITSSTTNLRLFEGQSVEIAIEEPVSDQVIIPKSALVLRSGREVVFSYDTQSQLAKWNYVEVAFENDAYIAIREGIEPGIQVIIDGNLNLSHDAEVVVRD